MEMSAIKHTPEETSICVLSSVPSFITAGISLFGLQAFKLSHFLKIDQLQGQIALKLRGCHPIKAGQNRDLSLLYPAVKVASLWALEFFGYVQSKSAIFGPFKQHSCLASPRSRHGTAHGFWRAYPAHVPLISTLPIATVCGAPFRGAIYIERSEFASMRASAIL